MPATEKCQLLCVSFELHCIIVLTVTACVRDDVMLVTRSDGLSFLNEREEKLLSLPRNCFIAGEAVSWGMRRIDAATHTDVIALFQVLEMTS